MVTDYTYKQSYSPLQKYLTMPRYCSTARKVMTPGSVHTTLPSSNSQPNNYPVPLDGQGLELLHGFAGASQSLENIDNDKQKKGNGFKMFE